MSEKGEDSEQESSSAEIQNTILKQGNLLSFGSINLIFTLILKKSDLIRYFKNISRY